MAVAEKARVPLAASPFCRTSIHRGTLMIEPSSKLFADVPTFVQYAVVASMARPVGCACPVARRGVPAA